MASLLVIAATLCLIGAVEVALFGAIFTHGVYGSRMAWLFGVTAPLLVLAAVLGWLAARVGEAEPNFSTHAHRLNSGHAGRRIAGASLLVLVIPLSFFIVAGLVDLGLILANAVGR